MEEIPEIVVSLDGLLGVKDDVAKDLGTHIQGTKCGRKTTECKVNHIREGFYIGLKSVSKIGFGRVGVFTCIMFFIGIKLLRIQAEVRARVAI